MIDKDKTLLDVVMLVHDKANWADLAIRAVENNTRNKYRLIIIDMASVEAKTREMLDAAASRGHTVIRLAENKSFSNGCNVGATAGTSPFLCFLNDDAIVTEGWDTAMLQDASPRHVGLVGARSNYAAGPQGNPGHFGPIPFLVFVCVMLRRAVWNAVGAMDEVNFDGFSSEDLDYSWRVEKAGYELRVSNAYVLHAGSQTLAATTGDALARQRNDQKYAARLADKWGKEFVAAKTKGPGRVLVASYHAEEWTRVKFMQSLLGLKRSDGVTFAYYAQTRSPIHMARQLLADYATDAGFDWLVQLDDDATFPEDLIRRLLSHGREIVTALAYQRKPPHFPCIFEIGPDGLMGAPLEGWEHTGLRRVDAAGFHCSIMATSVFRKLREKGIRQYYGGFDNKLGEDFAFSVNCRKAEIEIHCDTDLISGHIGDPIVVDEEYRRKWAASQPR